MSTKQDKENYWRAHIEQAEKHPVSQMAYCREAGLEARKLYAARERIKAGAKKNRACKEDVHSPSRFAAVSVKQPGIVGNSMLDPRWVAQFILHLQGGGR